MLRNVPPFFIRYWIIVVFFVALTIQMYLVFGHDLTAWKGGGFGMFSVIQDREIELEAVAVDGAVYRDIDGTLNRDFRRVQKLPLDRHFHRLARGIERSTWYYDDVEDRLTSDPEEAEVAEAVRLTSLKLSLWEVHYDNRQRLAVPHLMKQKTYEFNRAD